jgi:uncharacterized protein YuzE
MLRLTFDAEANATYIYLVEGEKITHTTTVHEDGTSLVNLDFAGDTLVGVEVVSLDSSNKPKEAICQSTATAAGTSSQTDASRASTTEA